MFISPIDLVIVLAAVGFGGFYCWAQQRGLLTTGQAAEGEAGTRRITLAEAAAYAGVILLLVGGVTAISQRWNDIGRADPARRRPLVTGLPGARAGWAHSFGGRGGPGASFGRRRDSFASLMRSAGPGP